MGGDAPTGLGREAGQSVSEADDPGSAKSTNARKPRPLRLNKQDTCVPLVKLGFADRTQCRAPWASARLRATEGGF